LHSILIGVLTNLYNSTKLKPIIIENRKKGLVGEAVVKEIYKNRGSKIIPAKQGCDFIVINRLSNKKQYREYVEVKTGYSRQTQKQRVLRKKAIQRGDNYTIHYLSDLFVENYLSSKGDTQNEM